MLTQTTPKRGRPTAACPIEEDQSSIESGCKVGAPHTGKTNRLSNILAASDLSVGGARAMTVGAALAERAGTKLSVISIIEPPQCSGLLNPAELGIAGWKDSRQDEVWREIEGGLARAGIRSALTHVTVGDPATLIPAFAQKFHSTLIVIGAHGLSSFERILDGSTGERIIRHSGCPVLVATAGDRSGPFQRILVAVDLSPSSQAVLDTAGMLAQCDGSEVRVVNSEEPSRSLWRRLTLRDHRGLCQNDRWRFERLVRESHLPGHQEAIVLHGPAGRAVLSEARRWEADLIVLGARRFKLLSPTRLGRISRYVLRHGDRSIVVVPT